MLVTTFALLASVAPVAASEGSTAPGTSRAVPGSLADERRACAELRAAGDRGGALAACRSVVSRGGTGRDFRLAVAALVDMAQDPTPEELLEANTLAGAAVRLAPDEPWGYAARCDIARRWSDPELVAACLADLGRVAPAHAETDRVRALASSRVQWGWLVTGVLLLAVLPGFVMLRRLRRRRLPLAGPSAAGIAALLLLAGPLVQAQPPNAIPIDDSNPEASVPTAKARDADPLRFAYFLQELIEKGELASQRGDHQASIRYHRALTRAVPDRSAGFGKLCASLEAAGEREAAWKACAEAIGRQGARVEDFIRFVRLLLGKPGKLSDAEVKEADGAVAHLQAQPESRLAGDHLACEVATRLEGTERLERCLAALTKVAPNDPKTVLFQWTLAVRRGDREAARAFTERARLVGVPAAGIARMQKANTALTSSGLGRHLTPWRLGLVLVAIAMLAIAVLHWRRRQQAAQGA